MQTRQSIRDHIDIYRQFYAAGVVVFGFFVLILLGMELRHQKMAEIVNWPITRARIVESSFREVPSGNHGTDTSVVVSLKLSYYAS